MSKTRDKTQRFTRIHLENWRNFKKVDVNLQQRVFLVGPNASGKSNFLDAFRFLHDIVAPSGGFQVAVQKRGDVESLRCKASKKQKPIIVDATIGNNANPNEWEYALHINKRRSQPYIRAEKVFENGNPVTERPDGKDKVDKKRLTQTFLEQSHANREFRAIADFFETIRYLHVIPQVIKEPERFMDSSYDELPLPDYGGEFIDEIRYSELKGMDRYIEIANSILRIAVPQLEKLYIDEGGWGEKHLYVTFKHWLKENIAHDEKYLSDGTIRLLALIWTLLKSKGPLLLEEPELSLHPGVIRYIPQVLHRFQSSYNKQIIISTHSSELLQDEGIGLDEVLLLIPSDEGTVVKPASDFKEIRLLLEGGLNLADAVFPKTEPKNAHQLLLLGED
jgi:predicted ATPase